MPSQSSHPGLMNEFNMLEKCRLNPRLWPRIGLLHSCWARSQATSWGRADRRRVGLEKRVGRGDAEEPPRERLGPRTERWYCSLPRSRDSPQLSIYRTRAGLWVGTQTHTEKQDEPAMRTLRMRVTTPQPRAEHPPRLHLFCRFSACKAAWANLKLGQSGTLFPGIITELASHQQCVWKQ